MSTRAPALAALTLTLAACATPEQGGGDPTVTVRPAHAAPAAPSRPWVSSFEQMLQASLRPPGDQTNPRRTPFGALPGTLAVEHMSIWSTLRAQSRAQHDQVWLLLEGEGTLGLAAGGHALIGGSIVFVPANTVHLYANGQGIQDSKFLTIVGPDLDQGDSSIVVGARPAAAPPQGGAAPGPNVVPNLGGAANGLVVHLDTERARLDDQLRRAGGSGIRMLYAGRHLTLHDGAVVGDLDLTCPTDQLVLILEGPLRRNGVPVGRLTIGGRAYEADVGHIALVPGGTTVIVEGGTDARPNRPDTGPVVLMVVRPTQVQ